jgi:pyrophosphatase PpaX
MWRCIIFDMDGTLTQTNQLIFDSFNHIAESYQGKRFSDAEITAMFGPPEEGALLTIVGETKIESALAEYLSFYSANHERLARLYPGVREILDLVKSKDLPIALFTGKGVHTTRITLQEFALEPYFDYVVTGNDVLNHKPSGEGIVKILDKFGLDPAEALMVGDSVADVRASREAHVQMAAALWDSYAKERVEAMTPDYLFHDIADFHSWLKKRLDSTSPE